MTLDEAQIQVLRNIENQVNAIKTAANNGKPLFTPDGRPLKFNPPPLGDLIVSVMQANHVLIQTLRAIGSTGFVLADEEANRVADLILRKLREEEQTKPPLTQTP